MDKLLCYNLFMKSIKIKCPAKINLTLEILNKRSDGFHNIKSIMQMINLYDYLTINIKSSLVNLSTSLLINLRKVTQSIHKTGISLA